MKWKMRVSGGGTRTCVHLQLCVMCICKHAILWNVWVLLLLLQTPVFASGYTRGSPGVFCYVDDKLKALAVAWCSAAVNHVVSCLLQTLSWFTEPCSHPGSRVSPYSRPSFQKAEERVVWGWLGKDATRVQMEPVNRERRADLKLG